MYKIFLFLVHILIVIVRVNSVVTKGDTSDIFASTFQMQALLQAEIDFVNYFTQSERNSSEELFQNISDIYKDYQSPEDLQKYVSHPLNSFGVVSRTMKIKKLFNENSDVQENYPDLFAKIDLFPPIQDYVQVCSSIALIQETMDLNTTHIAEGMF